jgi:hypothetical protein
VDLPFAHEVVEGPKRFHDVAVLVPAVDVVEVEIVRVQPVEGPLYLGADVFASQSRIVRTGFAPPIEREVHLRGDDEILPVVVVQPLADVALRFSVRRPVDVRGVEEVDAPLPRRVEQFVGLLAVRLDDAAGLPAEAPRAVTEL